MLIRRAQINFTTLADVRIGEGRITALGELTAQAGELVIEAKGNALLPGLHDHHLHLIALAKAAESIPCGPPAVSSAEALAQALGEGEVDGAGWLRGIGYHESVAGEIDRAWLDRVRPDVPLRIQHRSGRLWILNSAALSQLKPDRNSPAEQRNGELTGRIYDADDWLRQRLPASLPPLAAVSAQLAARGITGVTDTTPANGVTELNFFAVEAARGALRQTVWPMGDASLNGRTDVGPLKFHLHETALPDFVDTVAAIATAHEHGRGAAFHCVTVVELVFALTTLQEAGRHPGDRIEHASIAPPAMMELLADTGVPVITQPNFIAERGDAYRADVPAEDQPWLYRGAGFLKAGIPLAAGTDAPFGDPDPWQAMAAAVQRRTRAGVVMAAEEALSPEQAVALFLSDLRQPGGLPRCIERGAPADLCLLDRSWGIARQDLAAVKPAATWRQGCRIF